MKLIDGFDSNYRYILVAARRARQLQGGAPPVIETHSRKPCRIAQARLQGVRLELGPGYSPHNCLQVTARQPPHWLKRIQ